MKKVLKIISDIFTFIVLLLSNIIFCVLYYIKKYLGAMNFYQVMYHIFNTKSNEKEVQTVLKSGIDKCLWIFIILSVIEIILFIRWKKEINLKTEKERKIQIFPFITSKYRIIFSIIILGISIFSTLHYLDYKEYRKIKKENTNIYDKYYVDTKDVNIEFKEKKRNLILIYLESVESTLFSKKNNGAFDESRIPELEKIAQDNISFSHTKGLGGRYETENFTYISLVASTSATPYFPAIYYGNKMESNHILPNVRTLGDVLKENNYNTEFMQGSEISFAGTRTYIKDHGYDTIFDNNTAKVRGYVPRDYHVWWGIEDKKVFEYAKKDISDLAQKSKPFAFTLATMDTHYLDGYLDSSCEEPFDDQMSNVFRCSSKMVNEFINWIKEQDFYDDTMIVLIGDHLTMQSSYFEGITDDRYVYNAFINSKKKNVKTNNRIMTNYDIYPTILSGLGATIEGNKIGFGVNLFSNEKTITEKIGFDYFMEEKTKHSEYYDKYIIN